MHFFRSESLYPVKTKYIVADFSHGKEIYEEIEKQLSGIPVGILGKLNHFVITRFHQFVCVVEFMTHELNVVNQWHRNTALLFLSSYSVTLI